MLLARPTGEAPASPAHRLFPAGRLARALLAALLGAVLLSGALVTGALAYRDGVHRWVAERARDRVSPNYWRAYFAAPALPVLAIDMKFRDLEKIRVKREEALRLGVLFASDEDLVPAQIRFEGRTVDVRMRLKGDWTDHLTSDKWSFRIHVRGDDQILGMRRFSIQHPTTRNYIAEWAMLENLRTEGVLAPRYHFVNVIFNGDRKGIYALEEFFAREMIEAQGRREGVFVAADDTPFWQQIATRIAAGAALPEPSDYRELAHRTYQTARVQRDPGLAAQFDEARRALRGFREGSLRASDVFDVALLARYLAVVELWSAPHAVTGINSVFYFNPVTSKLEPVGSDNTPFLIAPYKIPQELYALQQDWTRRALEDPEVARAYVEETRRVASPEYLQRLTSSLGGGLRANLTALHREWPRLGQPWNRVKARQEVVRAVLAPPGVVQAFRLADDESGGDRGAAAGAVVVQVANTSQLPVEVQGFRIGDRLVGAAGALLTDDGERVRQSDDHAVILKGRAQGELLEFVEFALPAQSAAGRTDAGQIEVLNRLVGEEETRETTAIPYPSAGTQSSLPRAPTAQEVLARHPYLTSTGGRRALRVRPGTWHVKGDLVLPDGMGLEAGPGTTLLFEPNAVLLTRGPLVFRGTADRPVVLRPQERAWSGLVVLDADGPSQWEHVIVTGTRGVERGGWVLTGGITFYASPVVLVRTHIAGSSAEDAINVISTSFEFNEVRISDTASDAFDGDFTEGVIRRSAFHNIGGDAIDVSGSKIEVLEVSVTNAGDKGLSIGEASRARVARFRAAKVGIGVASKDLSEVVLSDSVIRDYLHAALAAFVKKGEYGPAGIRVERNVTLGEGVNRTLIQTGSWIWQDGGYIGGTDLDVKKLYDAGILGN